MGNPQDIVYGGGTALLNALFGGNFGSGANFPGQYPGFFDWAAGPGQDPGQGGINLVANMLKSRTLGQGVAPNMAWNTQTGQLYNPGHSQGSGMASQLLGDSAKRFFGGPDSPDWSQNWDHWFATDVTGSDGVTLQSPYDSTGLRLNSDYNKAASQSDPFNTIAGIIQLGKAEQPNVTEALQFMRGVDATSPYQVRGAQDYASMMRDAQQGGPNVGNVTQQYLPQIGNLATGSAADIGQAGWKGASRVGSTADDYATRIGNLGNSYEDKLIRDIDTKAGIDLDNELQGTQAALQAAGLGRSGAGQQALLGAVEKIKGQAARDKISALSDFRNQQAARDTQGWLGAQQIAGQGGLSAMDIASRGGLAGMDLYGRGLMGGMDLEAQGVQQRGEQVAQALLQGLGNEFQAGQQYRGAELDMMNQQLQRMQQERMGDKDLLLQGLLGGGDLELRQHAAQDAGQSQALADYMNLFNQRENYRGSMLDELYRGMAGEQGWRQAQTTDMFESMGMPLQLMLNLAGMSGPATQRPNDFWSTLLGGLGNQLGQYGGQALGGYAGQLIFGPNGGG